MTEDEITACIYALESAGLIAKAGTRRDGTLVTGGTHTTQSPDHVTLHGVYSIELAGEAGFRVHGECAMPGTFATLAQATAYVIQHWKPIDPRRTPIRRG